MVHDIVIIAIYTVIVLAFVPLDRIGRAQNKVKDTIKKIKDKAKEQ
jgi:hypothetical protein